MNNKIFIALDQGSSSSRALAFDAQGRLVARAVRGVDTRRPAEGLAEFDAWALLAGQLEALFEVLKQLPPGAGAAALAVASQRSTVVFWDKQTGRPLAPALSWQDGRATQEAEQVPLSQEEVHRWTGLYKTPFYSAPKITWTLKNHPQAAQAAQAGRLCVGPVASYLIWHLTQGRTFACDPTQAQRTLLLDLSTRAWHEPLLSAFGVQRGWLPEIKHTVDDYGVFEHEGWRIPIRVCIGDQQAALQALRVGPGGACINYGTGAFFMCHTGTECQILPGLLTSPGVDRAQGAEYLLEGPVNACGTVFTWLNALGISFAMEEVDALCAASKHPVQLLPALGGLGAPYWDFTVSPVWAGLSPATQKADLVRGAVDGIALLLADIVFYAERYGVKSREIKVAGGLSKSRALLQTQADILQTQLLPCAEAESTAAGAALLAAQESGLDTQSWQTVHLLPAVQPQLEPFAAEERYQQWHRFLAWCKQRPA